MPNEASNQHGWNGAHATPTTGAMMDHIAADGNRGEDDLKRSPLPGRRWSIDQMAEARTRVARGLLVYRPSEIATVMCAEAAVEKQQIEQRAAGTTGAGVHATHEYDDSRQAARACIEDRRAVAARIASLGVGDVPGARALAASLAQDAYPLRRSNTAVAMARATVLRRGAELVQQYLLPHCIVWDVPPIINVQYEREILTRVLAGAADVRTSATVEPVPEHIHEPCLSSSELRRLVEITDSLPSHLQGWRPAPGPGRGPGVVLFRPAEVAHMLEAEASLYGRAAELLLQTEAEQGHGARLRCRGKDLAGAAWRVRRLAPGDVDEAVGLVERIRFECRANARRQARGLWESDVAHLELIADYVQEYLLPLRIDEQVGVVAGGHSERQVHRRWMEGAVDLRELEHDTLEQLTYPLMAFDAEG